MCARTYRRYGCKGLAETIRFFGQFAPDLKYIPQEINVARAGLTEQLLVIRFHQVNTLFCRPMKAGGSSRAPCEHPERELTIECGTKYVVRSIVTGTPTGPFLGVQPNNNSFEINAIDIHEVSNGRIVSRFRVEDWARALKQLQKRQ